jgi:hypothetical protein
MNEKEVEAVFPIGFCVECIRKLARGDGLGMYEPKRAARDGTCFSSIYCVENQVGAVLIERPGQPVEWIMRRPISIEGQIKAFHVMITSHEYLTREK